MAIRSEKPIILVVDDDLPKLDMFAFQLSRRYKQYEIVKASCVGEATDEYNRFRDRIECVITDHNMPDGLGADFVNHVRTTNKNVPILLHSGLLEEKEFIEACGPQRPNTRFMQKLSIKGENALSIIDGLLTISSGRVLLVNENDAVRKQAADFLRDQGYMIAEARDSQEALASLKDNPAAYSSIVIEGEPANTAIDLVADIRRRGYATPAIFVADGDSLPALKEKIDLLPGNNGVLAKGYDVPQLIDVMVKLRANKVGSPGTL